LCSVLQRKSLDLKNKTKSRGKLELAEIVCPHAFHSPCRENFLQKLVFDSDPADESETFCFCHSICQMFIIICLAEAIDFGGEFFKKLPNGKNLFAN